MEGGEERTHPPEVLLAAAAPAHIVEFRGRRPLGPGRFQAALDLGGIIGAPLLQPAAQLLRVRRGEEDRDHPAAQPVLSGGRRADLAHPLHVDDEEGVAPGGERRADPCLRGAVGTAVHAGGLEEAAPRPERRELVRGEKVVVLAVALPRAGVPGGGRDHPLQGGLRREQILAESGLPAARRTGEEEEEGVLRGHGEVAPKERGRTQRPTP